jgi:hypothetical protein
MRPLIFVGFDPRERAAYAVAKASLIRHASVPLTIKPIRLDKMAKRGLLVRPVERRDGRLWCPISLAPMATEFAISRFCVPFLCQRGWALFVDCDILCQADIAELFALADKRYAVMVVKHRQESGPDTKMDNQAQVYYARKNWSSVVLWNCRHPANLKLTTEALNTWPGRDLHAFKWLADDEIGELPAEWNHLVGVNPSSPAKLLHYTLGGPWLPNWQGGPLDDLWLAARGVMSAHG